MKQCKQCELEKLESDFYYGQKKCKECVKLNVREREKNLRQDKDWYEKEKTRHREKYHRLNYKEKHKPSPENKKKVIERYKLKYPEKYSAKCKTSEMKPIIKGNELHHWNYNKEFAKDIIELSKLDHAKIHRFIKYDKKTFMYKDLNGVLLDTKEKHLELINKVIENF